MNKKQSAVAIGAVLAGLPSAPVMAQSNATLYGVVDAYFSYGKMGDNKKTGIDSGGLTGSRVGFRGTEDLGNGLAAVFALEYALLNDANEGIGTNGLRARQQFVGLKGSFGFAGLGRQYAPGYYAFKYDGAIGTPWGPQAMLGIKAGATIVPASPARANNALNYVSPNMGGLTEWIRHRLRAVQLKHWRRGTTMYRELLALGASDADARKVAANSRC